MIESTLLEIVYLLLFGLITEPICIFVLIIATIIKADKNNTHL